MARIKAPFPIFLKSQYGQGGQIINNIDLGSGVYYRVHQFTTVGTQTFVAPTGLGNLEVFVLGGGGGGNLGQPGQWYCAGAAGSVGILDNNYVVGGGESISVTVGDGGVFTGTIGTNGGNSIFGSITSIGGEAPLTQNSRTGGNNTLYVGGTMTVSLGAGGGAGAGGNGSSKNGGVGSGTTITGVSVRYGGGGAGASSGNSDGTSVDGGGQLFHGIQPTPNRGGGGAGNQNGATGWVVVRYRIPYL